MCDPRVPASSPRTRPLPPTPQCNYASQRGCLMLVQRSTQAVKLGLDWPDKLLGLPSTPAHKRMGDRASSTRHEAAARCQCSANLSLHHAHETTPLQPLHSMRAMYCRVCVSHRTLTYTDPVATTQTAHLVQTSAPPGRSPL